MWNYRIIRFTRGGSSYLALHEVYYNEDGSVWSYTENAVDVLVGLEEGKKGLIETLEMMLKDAKKAPILLEEDLLEQMKKNEKEGKFDLKKARK